MKGVVVTLSVAAAIVGACADHPSAPLPADKRSFDVAVEASESPSHIVVLENRGVTADFAQRVEALGGSVAETYPAIGVVTVSGLTAEAAAALQANVDVKFVERDLVLQFVEPMADEVDAADEVDPAAHRSPTFASFYPRQWNMRVIRADQAWAAGKLGSSGITVAILDSGLDYTYPDLAGRVDLSRSRSFVNTTLENTLRNAFFPGMHPVVDMHGHGTHVGNTVVSNGHIVAGVTQAVTLIGVKVLGANGSGSTSGVLAGIMYAANQGAHVINMSLGTRIPISRAANPGLPAAYNRAIQYAISKGTTVVVSAGNENLDLDALGDGFKPYCTIDGVICISATGPSAGGTVGPWPTADNKAGYSNFGVKFVNVAAPGGAGGGFVWAACSKQRLQQNPTTGAWSRHTCSANLTSNFVVGMAGTSMAAPHVSGLAALIVEQVGKNPGAVRDRLHHSSDDLGKSGADPIYGKGRINVVRALGL